MPDRGELAEGPVDLCSVAAGGGPGGYEDFTAAELAVDPVALEGLDALLLMEQAGRTLRRLDDIRSGRGPRPMGGPAPTLLARHRVVR